MGKTKTATIEGSETQVSGEEKYKQKQLAKETKKAKVKGVGLKGGERVAAVSGDIIVEETIATTPSAKRERTRGKKIVHLRSKVDRNRLYPPADALKLIREVSYSKFDATVELHATTKKGDLNISVSLPHPFGKSKKVEMASEKTIDNLSKGKIDFDILLATSDMMPKLVQFAKLLGPKGLMPNPKNGTLIKDANQAKQFEADKITIKTEKKAPLIHVSLGKLSQTDKEILANLETVIKAVGIGQFERAFISATMSPSVKLKIN